MRDWLVMVVLICSMVACKEQPEHAEKAEGGHWKKVRGEY